MQTHGAACAHPTDKAITSFADSAVAVTSIVSTAADLAVELDGKTKTMKAAVSYAGHQSDYPFPPAPGVLLKGKSDADWAIRVALMKSIGAYAKALAEANDPALSKSIAETATSLSVAGAASALPAFSASPSPGEIAGHNPDQQARPPVGPLIW
jgi:hypothetical protein